MNNKLSDFCNQKVPEKCHPKNEESGISVYLSKNQETFQKIIIET